ncbi:hypothetical protein O4H61_03290 [Roseovarius aestuarii]|nr:hypothetical protein [Roseovarius aestuarii]
MAEPTERIAILLELQQQEFEKRAKSAGAAIDRLERKFNPLAAAEAKLEAQQKRYNAALEAGTITAQRHATGMDLVQREYDQTVSKVNGARASVVAMNSSVAAQTGFMTRNRSVFQQAGYQIGDFAVQVQGGQSALVAFSQQGSQLLGIMGPWGAVMGAVLAVGSSLAGVLWTLGDATEETKEKAKTFADRVGEAQSALSAMASSAGAASVGGLEALRKKYGDLTDEVKDMAAALFEIDKREALGKVSGVITDVADQIARDVEAAAGKVSGSLARAGTAAGQAEAQAYRDEIARIQKSIDEYANSGLIIDVRSKVAMQMDAMQGLREQLALLEGDFSSIGSLAQEVGLDEGFLQQISEAQFRLEEARDAGDFSAMATQLGLIRDLLKQSGDAVSQDVVDGVTRAEGISREMAARLEEGEEAANGIANADMTGNIGSAAGEAQELANWLGVALSRAIELSATTPTMADEDQVMSQSVIPDAGQRETNRKAVENFLKLTAPKKVSGGGGSSKPKQEQEPLFSIAEAELEKLQRTIEMLGKSKAEIAELTVKQRMLDEAKKRGMTITDELLARIDAEAASVGELANEYDQARDQIAALEEIQGSFKDSVIDAAMGGADAMDQFVKSIKRAALEYLLFGEGIFAGGSKGSGGGLLGSLFGGVGKLLSFDGGGYTGGGSRSGGVDGRGGFPAILHPNETVVDHTKSTSQGRQTVEIVLRAPEGFTVEQISQVQGISVSVAETRINANNRTQADQRYLRGGQ